MTIIYLIRHGETMWNREKRLQGHIDIGLNERGHSQAKQIGQHLSNRPIAAVISSDLSRAMDTAQAIAVHHQIELLLDKGLRERHYGVMQGLSHDEIIEKHPRHHMAWKNREIDFVPEFGESLQQFYDRVLHSTKIWAERFPNQTIAIVAHGGVLDCLNRAATKRSLDAARDFEILNASLNTLSYKEGELELIEWGNVAHLQITDEGNDYSLDEVDGSPKWV